MSKTERNYEIGYGKPPAGRRFQKGRSGNPRGPAGPSGSKSLPALLVAALDEPVTVTINGKRRRVTKREAIVTQMVDKSASADLRATKMLIDMLKDVEHKAGDAAPPPEPAVWPRRTRRWCSCSSRGCGGKSCTRSKRRSRQSLPDS